MAQQPDCQLPHLLLVWLFALAVLQRRGHDQHVSIIGNTSLVKKVYFPREVLPISSVLANLVNFLLALVVLFGMLFVTHTHLSPYIWLLPVVILTETCFILGIAFFLSTLNVFYRDTMMIMDVVMQAWFFLTPVFYSIEILPAASKCWASPKRAPAHVHLQPHGFADRGLP